MKTNRPQTSALLLAAMALALTVTAMPALGQGAETLILFDPMVPEYSSWAAAAAPAKPRDNRINVVAANSFRISFLLDSSFLVLNSSLAARNPRGTARRPARGAANSPKCKRFFLSSRNPRPGSSGRANGRGDSDEGDQESLSLSSI